MKGLGFPGRTKAPAPGQESHEPSFGVFPNGHVIAGRYKVYGVLGSGGFGRVYLVQSVQTGGVYALKTFRDRFLRDLQARNRFRVEASTWISLDRHPNIVSANSVDELDGRLYIALEYVPPNEHGINSLEGYFEKRPPRLAQSLRWAIGCCNGMEYAYSKGLRAHRDLKPTNILIGSDGIAKITDFGLASAIDEVGTATPWDESRAARIGLAAGELEGAIAGTPHYMAPEQFSPRTECNERTDLYSFGVVLFQMATGGRLPFSPLRPRGNSETSWAKYFDEVRRLHEKARVPRIDSALEPIIRCLLEKDPVGRYSSFAELRGELEALLYRTTGESVAPPEPLALDVAGWVNKGLSLRALGRNQEAVECFDNALDLDPDCATAWLDKGVAVGVLGRHAESVSCYRRVVELDPQDVLAWNNLGRSLLALGRDQEALTACGRALKLDPGYGRAWNTMGTVLTSLGQRDEALAAFDKAVAIDPNSSIAWKNRGSCLARLGRHKDAVESFAKAVNIDPLYTDAWVSRGLSLAALRNFKGALACYETALGIDPSHGDAWAYRGNRLIELGRHEEALASFERAIRLDAKNDAAWEGKGEALISFGMHREALVSFDRALRLIPPGAVARRERIQKRMERALREASGRR
jgi:tetratricopeptide (TPR) repeat protein